MATEAIGFRLESWSKRARTESGMVSRIVGLAFRHNFLKSEIEMVVGTDYPGCTKDGLVWERMDYMQFMEKGDTPERVLDIRSLLVRDGYSLASTLSPLILEIDTFGGVTTDLIDRAIRKHGIVSERGRRLWTDCAVELLTAAPRFRTVINDVEMEFVEIKTETGVIKKFEVVESETHESWGLWA